VARNEKQRDIDTKLRDLEARLRSEWDAAEIVGPPPEPYEAESPVGINAIRSIRRDEG